MEDIDHYKNCKSFATTIEWLYKTTTGLELYKKTLDEIITKLENDHVEKIRKRLFAFVEKNKKKYIKKTITKDYTIYETTNYYEMYINNNKANILEIQKKLFPTNKITEIKIDGHKRKNIEKLEEDFKNSKSIKIKIEK